MNKTFVKIYADFDRTIIMYAGNNREMADNVTIQSIEGDKYVNFGGAMNTLEIWEDGINVESIDEYFGHPDDEIEDECN